MCMLRPGSYKAFADLLASDGYEVRADPKPFDGQVLDGIDLLIIANARGECAARKSSGIYWRNATRSAIGCGPVARCCS